MPEERSNEHLLFVIGASAGGIDALERLIGSLPATFEAPIVVAQHLDPSRVSRLAPILQGCTSMEVVSVADSAAIKAGTIYVVPAGQHVEISDRSVSTTPADKGVHPLPSIDLLFTSAARAFGERAVAVVLSGTGSDGASGAQAVKQAGGTVVIQDPATAAYPGLPASIASVNVDLVSDIDNMGQLLGSIADAGGASAQLDDDTLRAFLTHLRVRSGIDFTQYKMPTIIRRLSRLMAAAHCSTLAEYTRYLNANPGAYQRLITSFLIKVTGFFRDPELFEYLRDSALPEIIAEARRTGQELRIWSAGCATGEEAYSIAILIAEILGDQLDALNIRIFATDLDAESIVFARRGVYPASAFRDMPQDLLAKHFTRIDDAYQVKKRIRNLGVFGEYDLGQRAPFTRIDLIVCRNVLMYFTKELQQRTLRLFAFSLRNGGYLVLGKAETTNPLPQFFGTINPALKVFQRQGERLLISTPAFTEGVSLPERIIRRDPPRRQPPLPNRTSESLQRSSLAERLGSFLFESNIGVVFVDANYDIQAINQAARMLLNIHGQAIGDDLIHLASNVDSQELKSALDAAFRSQKDGRGELLFKDSALDQTRYLQVSYYPERDGGRDSRITGLILLVEDVTKASMHRKQLEEEWAAARTSVDRVMRQNSELLERQRSLVEANNELDRQ